MNPFGQQEWEVVELASGVWTVEYEGNVLDFLRIERCDEYEIKEPQTLSDASRNLFGRKIKISDFHEMAVLHIRTERSRAKRGLGLWRIALVSLEGKKFESPAISLKGTDENQFDPIEHFYEVPIAVPQGTRFDQIILFRQRDDLDPKRREEIIIYLPGGA